ncbi:MAG: serine hydrolase [Eubacterium sp.]|nr:serine hydrolase [Eubacterium sp.]
MTKRIAALAAAGILLFSGCGTKAYELEHPYDVYGTSIHSIQPNAGEDGAQGISVLGEIPYFAQDLCVGEPAPLANSPDASAVEAAGVFHLEEGTITYAKNMYQKMYPASTTKILTAYTALKHADLDDTVTVSAQAASQAGDSSVCGLHTGDQLSLRTLLYGLLLESGNDAADAIAEHVSGSAENFAALMNEEAAALGATHSQFTNPHGLHDENHYTCVYDLYLFFHAALQYEAFETIIHTSKYTAVYKDASGASVTRDWETTDQFLTGEAQAPEGVSIVGGKTGTTNAAGYCLALYSSNADKQPLISIVLKADNSEHLYQFMAELLKL